MGWRSPGSTMSFGRFSRRELLRTIARLGAVLPASVLLPAKWAAALQKPRTTGSGAKTATAHGTGPGFSFVDVAAKAGLSQAVNVFGGIERKRYLLEEIGCGVALFDYDNDGWLDIFFVNGTRFEGIPPQHQPANFLFHNNRDGTFTNVTEKAGLVRSGWGQGCC